MEQRSIRHIELKEHIEQAIRGHVPQMSVPKGTTQNDVYQCIHIIMRENPDIFWFSHQWKYTEDDQSIRFQYTLSKERSVKAKKQIDDVIQNDFQINKVFALSVPEKVMYVYKWIALYCKYNIYSAYNQTIYSVFVHRNSVCTGYAKAAQYLLKILGVESRLIFGAMHQAEKGSRHCWLLVNINNNWYHYDPTFAVPEINNLLRKAGVSPVFGAEGLVYNCFCCDSDCIKHSRLIEDESELPKCNSTIDFKLLQNIPVYFHRTEGSEQLGVRGCLLSDAGSFSNVYLWHSEKGTQSVVKIYKNDKSNDLLRHELLIMRQLSSSNHVLHVLGVTENQDGLIIEQATPFADLLCSHYYQLSAVHFCKLLLDIIGGLQDCVKNGILYRDIHLNNIYRTSKGHYVLGDFGSCIWIDEDNPSNVGGVGSPWYSAPETYLNGVFNERSATYGVGMLAFFLLNDLFPPLWNEYGRESQKLRVHGHILSSPLLLKKTSCAFEQQMASVIKKSLFFEPNERYQTLSDLEDAFKQCISLVEDDDFLLIDGGSSERLFKYDRKASFNRQDYNKHTDFHSTCYDFPDIIVSNEETEQIAIVDAEGDGQADIILSDVNSDGTIDEADIIDLGCSRINDFAYTAGNPFDYIEPSDSCGSSIPPTSPGDFCENKYHERDRINDFATTAIGPVGYTSNRPMTYQPKCEGFHTDDDSSKGSIWSKIFKKRNKSVAEGKVYSSIFAPAEVKLRTRMVIQVYLHLFEETEKVNSLAKESQKDSVRRDYIPLLCKLKKEDQVDVLLNIYGESLLMSDKKRIVWQGSFTKCSFDYFVPKDIDVEELCCVAILTVNGAQVGEMRFVTQIVEQPRELHPEVFARQYKKIFISYAHQDESKVKYIARAYDAQGVDYFFDRHYLKPGDIFPLKIKEYIDSADLFILCWSANAAQSDYVDLERRQALERAFPKVKPFEDAPLSIYPMSIEPRAELPLDMRDTYNFEVI